MVVEKKGKVEFLKKYISNEEQIKELEDKGDKFSKTIDKLKREQNKVFESIQKLENEEEKLVLIKMFISGKQKKEVAIEMNYSEITIYRIKERALENLQI